MNITIEFAQLSDIPRLSELLLQVHAVHSECRPDLFERGSKKYTEQQLQEILTNPQRPVFVAKSCGTVVGYAFCVFENPHFSSLVEKRSSLYIDDICVDSACRRQGVGRALLNAVTDYARLQNCYSITLNVWAFNQGAMQFYKSMGLSLQKSTLEQIL